jgi:hypothetical protein
MDAPTRESVFQGALRRLLPQQFFERHVRRANYSDWDAFG